MSTPNIESTATPNMYNPDEYFRALLGVDALQRTTVIDTPDQPPYTALSDAPARPQRLRHEHLDKYQHRKNPGSDLPPHVADEINHPFGRLYYLNALRLATERRRTR